MPSPLRFYGRMAVNMYRLARAPAIVDPAASLRNSLANRNANFLNLVARVVYANPENPYHKMLRLARCDHADLVQSVERHGLEHTLEDLRRAGVYLTHDEFKGKEPIVRSGQVIPASDRSYDNSLVETQLEGRSSGSRSAGTRTPHSIAAQIYWEQYRAVLARELGFEGHTYVALSPILPSLAGLTISLRGYRFGWHVSRWYAIGGTSRGMSHHRIATSAMILAGKLAGAPCRFPRYLPENDFSPVAKYIARQKAAGEKCCVGSFVSSGVRVAAEAQRLGLDIRGTIFYVGGEALTESKRATIETTGSEVYPFYVTVETGPIGYACRRMKTGNSVHLFEDSNAVICHRKLARLSEVEVNSLLFTSLSPYSSRVLINAEMDDSGTIEKVDCDCLFSQIGFTRQIRDIASYGKLTGQGITLTGTDVVRVLEEALPQRFGGGPGDYQLVEEEGASQTLITLRVSPRVGVVNPDEIRSFFLEKLKPYYGGTVAVRIWEHAQGVRVVFAEPFATSTGKVLSLHLMGSRQTNPAQSNKR
jgi:hypothetical protein